MTYQMSREEKNGIVELALKASMAFGAYNIGLCAKGARDVAQMTKLLEDRNQMFAALTAAISALDTEKVRELCKQFQYRLEHDPLVPKAKGEIDWDSGKAQALVNAMRSLQSALEHDGGKHKDSNQDRIHVVKNRADTMNLYVATCQETGTKPLNGMTPGTIRFMLRQLDAQRESLVKAGDNVKAVEKAKRYKSVEQNFSWLLKQEDRPQNRPAYRPTQPQTPTWGDALPPGAGKELKKLAVDGRPARKSKGKQRP